MLFLRQGKTNWKYILIVVILAILISGGIWAWWYFGVSKEKVPEVKVLEGVIEDETAQPQISKTDRLFGKNVSSKPSVDQNSIFLLGVADDRGNVDWKTILTVSTIARVSPVLIIENKKSFDDFSPKLFIEQYSPSKIYLHNYNYNFPNIERIKIENVNSQLYTSSNFVVISNGNDYEASLTAASFAAHFNIPIFFTPLSSANEDLIKKWGAKKIGIEINKEVDYSLTIFEAIDIMKKNSDYLILTTSDDLNKLKRPRFSLGAPILVGGRKGVLIDIKNPTRESVKSKVVEITKDGFAPSYIVVVGSEKNFPFLDYEIVPPGTYFNQDDDHQYFVNLYYWANYNPANEYIPDAAVGVITGYSVSDISSLIARSLFYDRIVKSNKIVYWSPYSDLSFLPPGASLVESILDPDFSKKYINNFNHYNSLKEKSVVINELKNSSVFIYNGHGWRDIIGNISIDEIPTLRNPTFVFAFSCGALQPWNPGTPEDEGDKPLISYEMIRKGAVGFLGAAEIWFVSGEGYYGYNQRKIIENTLNMPLGEGIFLAERMFDAYYLYLNQPLREDHYYKSYIYLLGDPKLKIRVDSQFPPNIFSEKIRMDISRANPERVVCYISEERYIGGGGCALCKFEGKECKQRLKEELDKVIEFNFPLLLDSYIFSTDVTNYRNIIYFKASLQFFTKDKIKDIEIKSSEEKVNSPFPPISNLGKYCFYFNQQKYCPNLIRELIFGSINPVIGKKVIPQYLDILFIY